MTQKLEYILLGDETRHKVRRCRLVTVPGHDTDHRTIGMRIKTNGREVCRYRHVMETFPLKMPTGPKTHGETMFGRQNELSQQEGCYLMRKIHASLKANRVERAWRAGEEITKNIGGGCIREAWHGLQGWYRHAEGKPENPCYRSMDTQTTAR